MAKTLLRNIDHLSTFDNQRREISDGAVMMDGPVVTHVGTTAEVRAAARADVEVDMAGHLVMPGLVNTHHHFFQCMTRVMAQQSGTFEFLQTLYPVWERLDDRALYTCTQIAVAELLLSGCTTTADHHYVIPAGVTIDAEIEAASAMGIRLHASRGSMSLGASQGGLPPDSCTEKESAILADSERLIARYHDASRHAMLRIVLAPCSPFSVTPDLMQASAELARRHDGVRLHSHIAQDVDEERFALQKYGKRSVAMVADLGWTGPDVWFAHSIFLSDAELDLFASTGTGIAHCPTANMRIGAGIARIADMLARGVPVSIGVDGAASSEIGNMFTELQRALFLQRIAPRRGDNEGRSESGVAPGNPSALSARQVLDIATRGGAKVLGRDDIGHLAPGMSADLIAIDLNQFQFAGAQRDFLAALVLCGTPRVAHSFVHGRQVVRDGRLCVADEAELLSRHREEMKRLYAL